MRVEAPLGVVVYTNGHSPQVERAVVSQRTDIPKSYRDFLVLLASDLPMWWTHAPRILLDGAQAFNEGVRLGQNPVYKDSTVPRGDGSAIEIFPGFLASKRDYQLPVDNLNQLGWEAEVLPLRFGRHVEPTLQMVDPAMDRLERRAEETGEKVKIVAHSKGVHVTLGCAMLHPERFSGVVNEVVLVAGAIPNWVNLAAGATYIGAQIVFRGNDFRLGALVSSTEGAVCLDGIRVTTIKVRKDPVMDGHYIGAQDEIFEIGGSHSGAVHNNLRLIAVRIGQSNRSLQRERKFLPFKRPIAA